MQPPVLCHMSAGSIIEECQFCHLSKMVVVRTANTVEMVSFYKQGNVGTSFVYHSLNLPLWAATYVQLP